MKYYIVFKMESSEEYIVSEEELSQWDINSKTEPKPGDNIRLRESFDTYDQAKLFLDGWDKNLEIRPLNI